MDIDKYLKDKTKRFEKTFNIVRDLRVFDFNFIPDTPPIFRAELRPVIDALIHYERTGIPHNLLICGSRGSGKTLSLRYLQRLFRERGLNFLYVNCRIENTSYKILAYLLETRARGVSFAELAARFTDAFSARTVVILDEVDLLSEKDKRTDVLYFLSRAQNNYMTVLLSNNPKWSSTLDPSIASSLQAEELYFAPYNAWQIAQILKQRASSGLAQHNEETLGNIAALTAKLAHGDARIAIKTLLFSAIEPDCSLDDSFNKARRDLVIDVVRNLTDQSLLILRAAGNEDATVKQVYEKYRRLCVEQHEISFSYVYFYSTLSYLQSLGLILLAATKVHRSYTKLIQITFPLDVLNIVWQHRFAA